MAGNQTIERFFESVAFTSEAILTAARDQNERQYRLSEAMLLEMQRVQHENIGLGKHFAENPLDVGGMYRLVVEMMSKRQGRALELGREVITTLAESATGARETARKMISMQRAATEAATETASHVANAAATTFRESAAQAASVAGSTIGSTADRIIDDTVRTGEATAQGVAQTARTATAMTAGNRQVVGEPKRRRANGRGAQAGRSARANGSRRSSRARRDRGANGRRKRGRTNGRTAAREDGERTAAVDA